MRSLWRNWTDAKFSGLAGGVDVRGKFLKKECNRKLMSKGVAEIKVKKDKSSGSASKL